MKFSIRIILSYFPLISVLYNHSPTSYFLTPPYFPTLPPSLSLPHPLLLSPLSLPSPPPLSYPSFRFIFSHPVFFTFSRYLSSLSPSLSLLFFLFSSPPLLIHLPTSYLSVFLCTLTPFSLPSPSLALSPPFPPSF